MNRRDTLVALLALGGAPLQSFAQPLGKVPRIGVAGVTTAASYASQVEAMRQGFRDLELRRGSEYCHRVSLAGRPTRSTPGFAAELVRLQPDVIVTSGVATRALKEATTTIPIVMAASGGDAVASGLIASLAEPGGNITGSTFFGPEISAKRMEMLKEAVPRLAKVAVLLNPGSPYGRVNLELMK